jgi:hypothetical protein
VTGRHRVAQGAISEYETVAVKGDGWAEPVGGRNCTDEAEQSRAFAVVACAIAGVFDGDAF